MLQQIAFNVKRGMNEKYICTYRKFYFIAGII